MGRASMLAHGVGAAALAVQPGLWPWVLGGVVLNHAILACGMHPRSGLIGQNLARLPAASGAVAITFDDGPEPEVTPRVLDLLDAQAARATFFLIGERAARHPALVREILRRGHAVGNHTHRHPLGFAAWGPWRQRREVAAAQAAIAEAGGVAPRLFRAPAGLRNPLLDPVLAAEGLSLVSWTRRGYDTVARRPERVLARVTRGLGPGDILLLHDGNCRSGPDGRPTVLAVLPALLRAVAAAGLTAVALEGDAAAPQAAAAAPGSPASA
jgi:peptidoglycan/xylan/chitin deacetylase (PgdA/CDA1 family)